MDACNGLGERQGKNGIHVSGGKKYLYYINNGLICPIDLLVQLAQSINMLFSEVLCNFLQHYPALLS